MPQVQAYGLVRYCSFYHYAGFNQELLADLSLDKKMAFSSPYRLFQMVTLPLACLEPQPLSSTSQTGCCVHMLHTPLPSWMIIHGSMDHPWWHRIICSRWPAALEFLRQAGHKARTRNQVEHGSAWRSSGWWTLFVITSLFRSCPTAVAPPHERCQCLDHPVISGLPAL